MNNKVYCVLRGCCRGDFFNNQIELNREILIGRLTCCNKLNTIDAKENFLTSCEEDDANIKDIMFTNYFTSGRSFDVEYIDNNITNLVDRKSFILEEEEYGVAVSCVSMDDAKARLFDFFCEEH